MNVSDYIVTYKYGGETYLSSEFLQKMSNVILAYQIGNPIVFYVKYPDLGLPDRKFWILKSSNPSNQNLVLKYVEYDKTYIIDEFKTLSEIVYYLDSKDFTNCLTPPRPLAPVGSIIFGYEVIGYEWRKWTPYRLLNIPLGVLQSSLALKDNTRVG